MSAAARRDVGEAGLSVGAGARRQGQGLVADALWQHEVTEPKTWPLWAVPLLLLLVILLAVYISAALGWLGLVPLVVFIWWIQKKADEHVRSRQS